MLVLTRKLNQSIAIGGDVVITITALSANQVRIGISAPKEVVILRTELQNKKEDDKRDE